MSSSQLTLRGVAARRGLCDTGLTALSLALALLGVAVSSVGPALRADSHSDSAQASKNKSSSRKPSSGKRSSKKKPTGGAKRKKVELPSRLPRDGYAEELESVASENAEARDVRVSVNVIPDAYRYNMARGIEELARAGYQGKRLEKELRELHAEHKAKRGRVQFDVKLTGTGASTFFLQGKTKSHVLLKHKTRKSFVVDAEKPKVKFTKWSVFELPPDQPRRVYKKALFRFNDLRFAVRARLKLDQRDPIEIAIAKIVRVTARLPNDREGTTDDAFEGVNLGQKQISATSWGRIELPNIELRLYPREWEIPEPPEEFEQVIRWCEAQ